MPWNAVSKRQKSNESSADMLYKCMTWKIERKMGYDLEGKHYCLLHNAEEKEEMQVYIDATSIRSLMAMGIYFADFKMHTCVACHECWRPVKDVPCGFRSMSCLRLEYIIGQARLESIVSVESVGNLLEPELCVWGEG